MYRSNSRNRVLTILVTTYTPQSNRDLTDLGVFMHDRHVWTLGLPSEQEVDGRRCGQVKMSRRPTSPANRFQPSAHRKAVTSDTNNSGLSPNPSKVPTHHSICVTCVLGRMIVNSSPSAPASAMSCRALARSASLVSGVVARPGQVVRVRTLRVQQSLARKRPTPWLSVSIDD